MKNTVKVVSTGEILSCSYCGERNRKKLHIEDIGIALGTGGYDFTFCKTCWTSPDLYKRIERVVGFKPPLKLRDDLVEPW